MYGYNYGLESSLLAMSGTTQFITFALWVLQIVGLWMIFKKAGEAGWKSIIPIYSDYIKCKIAGRSDVFGKLILSAIGLFISIVIMISGIGNGSAGMSGFGLLLMFVLIVLVIVLEWKVCKGLALNFGQSTAFGVGLLLLGGIFTIILGLGQAKYVAGQPAESIAEPQPEAVNEQPEAEPVAEAEAVEQPTPAEEPKDDNAA